MAYGKFSTFVPFDTDFGGILFKNIVIVSWQAHENLTFAPFVPFDTAIS
jgi:hypothetical protein